MVREDTIGQEVFVLGAQQEAGFQQEAMKGTPALGHSLSKGPTHRERESIARSALGPDLWRLLRRQWCL